MIEYLDLSQPPFRPKNQMQPINNAIIGIGERIENATFDFNGYRFAFGQLGRVTLTKASNRYEFIAQDTQLFTHKDVSVFSAFLRVLCQYAENTPQAQFWQHVDIIQLRFSENDPYAFQSVIETVTRRRVQSIEGKTLLDSYNHYSKLTIEL